MDSAIDAGELVLHQLFLRMVHIYVYLANDSATTAYFQGMLRGGNQHLMVGAAKVIETPIYDILNNDAFNLVILAVAFITALLTFGILVACWVGFVYIFDAAK